MSSDLQCARCGAPLALPSDFGVWLVRCQYCGFEHELPDRPARQAYAEQQRQDAARAAQAQAQAAAAERARQTTLRGRRATLVGSIAVTLVILVGVTGWSPTP